MHKKMILFKDSSEDEIWFMNHFNYGNDLLLNVQQAHKSLHSKQKQAKERNKERYSFSERDGEREMSHNMQVHEIRSIDSILVPH